MEKGLGGVLITRKGLALKDWVELIKPPETARLAAPSGNSAGDQGPIPGPELTHQPTQDSVFFLRPNPSHSALTLLTLLAFGCRIFPASGVVFGGVDSDDGGGVLGQFRFHL